MMKHIYEHLKTKKKYNTLMLKYEVKCDELERKQVELNTEKRIHQKQRDVWESKLIEQEKEIIRLKEENENIKSRKELKI